MRLIKIIFFNIVFITFSMVAVSQTWNVKSFNLEDGLSQSQILSLFQDKKGNLWIGTNGGGVNIYNGKKFTTLTQKDGLVGSVIYSIAEDKNGVLYFGTNEGLSVLKQNKFYNYSEKDGLPHKWIFKVYIDNEEKIWLATEKGVVNFEHRKFIKLTEPKILENTSVHDILKDKSNNFWFGTTKNGVVKYDFINKKLRHFTKKDSLFDLRIRAIDMLDNGDVLIATFFGLNIYDSKNDRIVRFGLDYVIGSVLAMPNSNDFWVAKYSGYVNLFRKPVSLSINNPDLPYKKIVLFKERIDKIYVLLIDRENNLWIGTDNGLKMFTLNKKFYNYSESDSLHFNNVTSILKSSKGIFWIGAAKTGAMTAMIDSFSKFTPLRRIGFYRDKTALADDTKTKKTKTHNKVVSIKSAKLSAVKEEVQKFDDYICNTYITGLLEDKQKNIWITTMGGVSRFDGKKYLNFSNASVVSNRFVQIIHPSELTSERVNCAFEDKDGVIWLGTYNGITQVKDTTFTNFNKIVKQFENKTVWSIYQDSKNAMWFCCSDGLYNYTNGKITYYCEKNNFTNKDVKTIAEDRVKNLWIATKDGVFCFDRKTFKKIDENNGLASNNIYLLVFDNEDNLFIASNKGLDVLNTKVYNASKKIEIKHFGKKEGFIGQEGNNNSYFKDETGRIWFGTVGGITVYDPKLITKNKVIPLIQILKIQLNYADIDSATILKYSKGIDSLTGLPLDLVFPYDKNRLTFHFVATSLSIPEKVQYQYILEGLTNEWSPASGKNEADYQGLPDGVYTFKVRACNDDGVWNEIPATFTFTIKPPFWKTWWFYTILIIVSIISVIFYIKQREKKLIQEKEVLEATVKERTAEIMQQKEEIETQRDEIMDKNEVLQEQKEEIQLQANELEKLSIVASETDNAVMIMDSKGNFDWINEGFTKMYGYSLDELKRELGLNIVADNTGNEHLKDLIDEGFNSKEPIIYESLKPTKWGEKIWSQTTITPIFNEANEVIKLVAIDSNINKMKLAEEEIKQQKEEIEAQRDEIGEQKNMVEEKNKDITDSINYAKNIQNAILPSFLQIKNTFPNTFILYKPRDIVSGDFYWYNENEKYSYFAAVDCTGHGVPGAFMSMLGFAFLNEIVNKDTLMEPNVILNKLRNQVIKSLHQEGKLTDSKDGMDIVLLVVDKQTKKMEFAGANNPLYLIRNNELIEYKGEKMPIAYHLRMDPFSKTEIQLLEGDTLYFFSDGLADQFGGPKGKKFMYKHLKELLVEINEHPMDEIHKLLDSAVEDWKSYIDPVTGSPYAQVDDVLVVGVRI